MLASLTMFVHKQMFRDIKTLQKWKLSTWEKITRQSNKTLVNLISIHGTRESDGLTQGAEHRGKDGISSSKDTCELGHPSFNMALVGVVPPGMWGGSGGLNSCLPSSGERDG